MKRYIKVSLVALLLCFGFLPTTTVLAGGGNPTLELSASASSSTADGSSKITFTVYTYKIACPSGYNPDSTCIDGSQPVPVGNADNEVVMEVSGSGNTIGGTYTASNGVAVVKTGNDGKASFTLASTVAESKTVKVYYNTEGHSTKPNNPTKTVTFSTPAPKTTTTKPSTSTPAPVVEVAAPEAPKAAALEVNGQAVTGDTISLPETESLVLKGTTVANGVVKLFIFSDPKEATTTADAQGNWTYEVAGLEPGDHHVEAEVTDPATNKTSGRATLAAFTVEAAPVETIAKTPPKNDQTWLWYVGGGILLLAAAGAGVWWWLKKHRTPPTNDTTTIPEQSSSSDDINSEEKPPSDSNTQIPGLR